MKNNKINKARALYYGMFSRFFIFSSDNSRYVELVNLINTLKENPLDTSTAKAFDNLANTLKYDTNVPFMLEFDEIFHSPQSSTIRTTASFYDEDIESGKKRLEMQNFLAKTKIRREEKKFTDYEDHIGFIFAVLSELCTLIANDETEYENTVHCIFSSVLNEFVEDFSKEVYEHESSSIFKNVIVILKAFIEFERIYLEVSIPSKKTRVIRRESTEELSDIEEERRARNRALREKGPKQEQEKVFVTLDVEDNI